VSRTPRVLVTGAGGFIGRQTLPILVAHGYEVHAVSSRYDPHAVAGVQWHRADLLAPGRVEALCADVRAERLLHLAWVTTPGVYTRDSANLDWTAASMRLVRAFVENGGTRVVSAGTCFEYLHDADDYCHETKTPRRPDTLYGTCKVALESVVARYAQEARFESAWGRVFFLYGPHEHPDRLVSSVIRDLLAEREALTSVGTQVRDFLHVVDVAAAFVSLLDSDVTGTVNIGSGEPVTVRDMVLEVADQLGRRDMVRLGARPLSPRDPARIVADVTRLRYEVGFAPEFTVRDGLADSIRWWADRSEHDTPSRSERA
jgi:nucleoside-diphosphate-sugar epimerase